MKLVLILILSSQCYSQNQILITFGPKTFENLKNSLKLYQSIDLSNFSNLTEYLPWPSPNLIFDISLDSKYFIQLDSLSGYFGVPYITLTRPFKTQPSRNRFYAFSSIENESYKIIQMIEYLMWDHFAVFMKNTIENLQTFMMLRERFSDFQIESIIYDSEITEKALDSLIKSYFIIPRNKNILVLDEGSSLELFVKLLKTHKINQYGNFYLFGPFNIHSVDLEGSLFLTYQNEINYESVNDFFSSIVTDDLSKFAFLSIDQMTKACPSSACSPKLNIVNQKYGKKTRVGEITDSVNIETEIIFPGNNTKIKPAKIKTKLNLMIANGTSELINSQKNFR